MFMLNSQIHSYQTRHFDDFNIPCDIPRCKDEFQINEINVDLRTSGFDVLSVDACAV